MLKPNFENLLDAVAVQARETGVFGDVRREPGRLECAAKTAAAPAAFRLEVDSGQLWVSLVMADRWLSHSIEADLLNTGDKLEELVEEELVELGLPPSQAGNGVTVEHFRSEEKLFTFRSPAGVDGSAAASQGAVDRAGRFLLAYEACFRNLGDMNAAPE